jgi:hypothetical protein
MKIETSMVKKLRITDIQGLDPISVIAENFGAGSGKITIECFGESWSHYWSHMGEQYTLETFFCEASDGYIAGKLCRGREDEADWDGMPEKIRKEIIKMRRENELDKRQAREYYNDASNVDSEVSAHFNAELLNDVFGGDWMCRIPDSRPTREYKYLCRIIPVVKSAFNQEFSKEKIAA